MFCCYERKRLGLNVEGVLQYTGIWNLPSWVSVVYDM
jgi:hypothetical protein